MLVLDAPASSFEFELGGKAYAIPHLDDVLYDELKGLRDVQTNQEAVDWIVANVFELHCPDAMRVITNGQLKALLDAYLGEAAVSPGESQA